jgi:hypothetical protein
MRNSPHDAVVSFLLQIDKEILLYILPADLFFAIAVVSVMSRGRKPLELLSLFVISFCVLFFGASLLFQYGFDRPFFLLDVFP